MDTSGWVNKIRGRVGVDGLLLIVVILIGVVVAASMCTKTDEETSEDSAARISSFESTLETI